MNKAYEDWCMPRPFGFVCEAWNRAPGSKVMELVHYHVISVVHSLGVPCRGTWRN